MPDTGHWQVAGGGIAGAVLGITFGLPGMLFGAGLGLIIGFCIAIYRAP
jgi:uncharacterized membrane protein SpoIIM required for sporulation